MPFENTPLDAEAPSTTSPDWTYLVNLDVTMWDRKHHKILGSTERFEEMKPLVDLTKDGKSQLIVQVLDTNYAYPIYSHIERYRFALGKMEKLSSPPDDLANPLIQARGQAAVNAAFKAMLDHGYTLGGLLSHGYARDLQSLIETAPSQGHLALLNYSHGQAGAGLEGDNGHASLTEVADGVKAGLKAIHRDHLEFFDLDACLMGDANAMKVLNTLADSFVASQMPEFVDPENSDTQPIITVLKDALSHPREDGNHLARDLVAEAAKECTDGLNNKTGLCGTPSLAMFDGKASDKFFEALTKFSQALQVSIKDPVNRKFVDKAASEAFSAAGEFRYSQLRDLQSFIEGVSMYLTFRDIKDDSAHSLENAMKGLTLAQNEFVPEHYGVLGALKGVNVFLPSADFSANDESDSAKNKEQQVSYKNNMGFIPGWDAFIRDLRQLPAGG